MIAKTAGAELCATHKHTKPSPVDCVRAYDETYKGRVDLSEKVKVGEPVQKSALHWSVPYDVSDAAGNKAATVWRDVIVEEVELEDVSSKLRREFEKEKEAAIRKAVDAALAEERSKASSRTGNRRQPQPKCPDCPKCTCPENGGGLDEAACNAMCEARMQSCAVNEHSWIVRIMLWLEGFLPASLAPVVLVSFAAFGTILFIRFIASFFVEQRSYRAPFDTNPENLQNHVTVYRPPVNGNSAMNEGFAGGNFGADTNYGGSSSYGDNGNTFGGGMSFSSPNRNFVGMNGGGHPSSAPPRSSMSLGDRTGNSGGLFTPTSGGGRAYAPSSAASATSARPSPITDIYEQSPLITPHRRGDGVRRRFPFSR